MPIQVASFIIPKNAGNWYVLEDKYIKGGLQTLPTSIERDAIPEENRKIGMMVVLQNDSSLWQLNSDLTTWTNLQLGGIEGPSGPSGERGEVGPSTYDVWLSAGNVGTEADYILSLKGVQGEVGPQGPAGEQGIQGVVGKSSYQEWLDLGNVGSEVDFLATFNGKNAYEFWLQEGNVGTPQNFFDSLVGPSAYQAWLDEGNVGDVGLFLSTLKGDSAYTAWIAAGNVGTEVDFIAALKGADGTSLNIDAVGTLAERDAFNGEAIGFSYLDEVGGNIYVLKTLVSPFWSEPIPYVMQGEQGIQGIQGVEGKSAYQVWVDAGNVGTEADYILSLKGIIGDQGPEGPKGEVGLTGPQGEVGPQGIQGTQGIQGEVGPQGIQGIQGVEGKSAYQVWVDAGNVGTEADYILSLKGATGETGIQGVQGEVGPQGIQGIQGIQGVVGDSAYQAWINSGNVGTEADFILSIKGVQGEQGIQGLTGPAGEQGIQGIQGIQGEVGPQGIQGIQGIQGEVGISAYQVWLNAGNIGTEADYILSLKGVQGEVGPQGPAGTVNGGPVEGNIDVNGNIKYKNIFTNVAAFPDALVYEGMFVVAEDTNKAYFSSDGAWIELANSDNRVIPYDISFFIPGTMPTANELVGAVICVRTIAISLGAPGSFAKAAVAPAANISYALNVNGVAKGSVNFTAGSVNGTFTLAANLTLVAGDIVQLVTPASIDASIKDVVITIVGRAAAPQLSMSF